MLRAIGANRRQVMRSVLLEATLVGVVASAAGVAGGHRARRGLQAVLSVRRRPPDGRHVVEPRTIVVSLLTGVVVTSWRVVAAGSAGGQGRADRGAA